MSFNIGGIGTGIQKGLQYDLTFMRNFRWAFSKMNLPALTDLAHIADTNAKEIAGEALLVTQKQALGLLLTDDPFQVSRQLMHDFETKYGNH